MLLVIDVGNTNITLGVFKGEELLGSFRVTTKINRTSDEFGITFREILRSNNLDAEEIDDQTAAAQSAGEKAQVLQNSYNTA